MAGLSINDEILVYQEIDPTKIVLLDISLTFEDVELQDGDIICIQPKLTAVEEQAILSAGKKPSVDAFLGYAQTI